MNQQTKSALKFLTARNVLSDHWDQHQYTFALMDFLAIHGDDSLQALAGFYVWCINNLAHDQEKQRHAIRSTFAHDLGGRRETCISPRSSDYLQYWQNQI